MLKVGKRKFQKIKTNRLSKMARTSVKCSICGYRFNVNNEYMWVTENYQPVCYSCANDEEGKNNE